jgi:tungstate transport system ATP-binding protein
MAGPLYRLENVVKLAGGRPVLEVERLELGAEPVTAVSGPNGAGKTTLLKLLALLERPDAGRVVYRGRDAAQAGELTRLRREVTYVSQDAYLFSGSVERNLAYGLGLRGMARAQRRRRAAAALERVGLAGFAGRPARGLSRGETQRVALARALALEPAALLLDEPFANLDPASAEVFERVIGGLPEEGTTVILVTHGAEQARRLARRLITLLGGRVAGDDPLPV